MELLINKDTVNVCETVYDGYTEQGVEFDYVLPDYYPDIFRIIKCSLTPGIVSYSVSGTQLICDGVVYIRVLYAAESGGRTNCVEHRYTYSKTVELPSAPQKPIVKLMPKADYCNCRAVSGRRLDVRGAISCKVKVTGCVTRELVTDISGSKIEKRAVGQSCCTEKLYASRQFVSREDIETGTGKGGISCIISHSHSVSAAEAKPVADKAVVKAEATLRALYLVDTGDGEETESMEATIPLSQIMDISGLTGEHIICASMRILDCDIEVKQDESGEKRMIACDLTVDCCVSAYAEGRISPVCDLFSTLYETDFRSTEIRAEHTPQRISEQTAARLEISCGEEQLDEIKDARCDITAFSGHIDESKNERLSISGQGAVQLVCRREDGTLFFIDRNEPFTAELDILPAESDSVVDVDVTVSDVSYSISSDNTVDLRLQLLVNGCICGIKSIKTVSDVSVNENMPKQREGDYDVKLYYADADEDIWSIAKRCNTGIDRIISENGLDGETVSEPCMLLIPIS